MSPPISSASSDAPKRRRRSAEILALASLAIAQPLFSVLSHGADFFVAHGSRPSEIVLLATLFYAGPALLLLSAIGIGSRLGRGPGTGRLVHAFVLAILAALLLMPWIDRTGAAAPVCVGVALLAGIGVGLLADRSAVVQSFLGLLAPLTLAVPLLFLLLPPISHLVLPRAVDSLDVEVSRPTPVILVVFDELPIVSLLDARREVDPDLFPNFAALAAQSYWFPDATSVSPATDEAVPAILTGRYPSGKQAAIASAYPHSLFTLLGERYEYHVTETQTRLCPEDLCPQEDGAPRTHRLARLITDSSVVALHIVTPSGWRRHLPPISATWTDFLAVDRLPQGGGAADRLDLHIFASDRARVVEDFLAELTPGEPTRPRLFFLHVMLPHIPWVYLPSGKEYWGSLDSSAFAHGVDQDTVWTSEEWLVAQGYQRHLLQLQYVDHLLGRLLQRIEEVGLAEHAVLVVTADHGLSFRPGQPGRTPTSENFADIMAVPLFVRTPGQTAGVVDDRNVELVDILPTIADLLATELPYPVDGESLVAAPSRRPTKQLTLGEDRWTYPREALEQRFDSLDRKLEIFDRGLFGIGPRAEILGRPVSELELGDPIDVEIRLDQAEQYRRVDLEGGYLPAQIFGRLRSTDGGEAGDLELALAINGIARAVTRTFEKRGTRFAAMVPEESFLQGANRVDVFVVASRDGEAVLRPTAHRNLPAYSVGRDATGRVVRLEGSDGTICHLEPDAVEGTAFRYGTGFAGWARDAAGERPFAIIMVFADDRLVHTVTTGVTPPPEAAVADRPEYGTSGFRFVVPAAVVDGSRDLRLFAVVGERGTELAVLEGTDSAATRALR